MVRLLLWGTAVLLTAGCQSAFKPETLVDGLRVMGVRAERPEIRPGEATPLRALAFDEGRASRKPGILWIACDPDPYNSGRTPCTDPFSLGGVAGGEGATPGQLPEGMRVVGLGEQAFYQAPATLFDVFPQDDPRRSKGTLAPVLALAVSAELSPTATPAELGALFERVKAKEVAALSTLFRFLVSESDNPNHNPAAPVLRFDGERLVPGAHVAVHEGTRYSLTVEAPESDFESYVAALPEGPVEKREVLIASFYSTLGRFKEPRWALGSEVSNNYTGPVPADNELPDTRDGRFWVVLRDSRGGQSWAEWPIFVCSNRYAAPEVSAVRRPAPGTQRWLLEGKNLDGVLDVVAGGVALVPDGAVGGALAFVGPDAEGPVQVVGRDCSRTWAHP